MKTLQKKFVSLVMVVVLVNFCMPVSADIDAPVSHWTFDEGDGTTAFDSAGSNNGAISGATWTNGKINNALNFSSDGAKVVIADSTSLDPINAFTLSAWVNPSQFRGNGDQNGNIILCKWASNFTGQYLLNAFTGGNVNFRVSNGSAADLLTVNNALTINSWQHIAAEWNGEFIKIYVNGLLAGEKSTNITSIYNHEYGDDYLAVGYGTGGAYPGWSFKGGIDDVRYYDYALSGDEVYQLYQIPEPITMALFALGAVFIRRK